MNLLDSVPLMRAMATGPVALPEVKAPSLEGIEITVPEPEDISADDVAQCFHELVRAHALTRDRSIGEPVQVGDDVQLDVVGYAGGRLIPFSARTGMWMEVAPIPALPGFAEGIVGTPVEGTAEVQVELLADHPVEELRGALATFVVRVRAAREMSLPDPESQEFLREVDRGETLEELMESLVEELEEELADQLWVEAQSMVLDEVARRTEVSIPAELVDEEIRRRWGQTEGRQLAELDFRPEEQQEALDGWLRDPATRADAERRLRISLALKAVAEAERLELTPEDLEGILSEVSEVLGIPPEQAREALRTDPIAAAQVRDTAWHLMVVGYVLDKARIRFEGAPEGE